jgi:hypothetical protein
MVHVVLTDYGDEGAVDARWYLDRGHLHDAAALLAEPGSTLTATAEEFRALQPLIEQNDVEALYFDGQIFVLTHAEAAALLREMELQQARRGPLPAPGHAPAGVAASRRSSR